MYLLFEKSGVGYAYRNRRLVNILALQEAVGIFSLYDDLVDRIIVDTHSDTMLVRPRIICSGRSRDIGIIILVPPENIEFLFSGKLVHNRENVVTGLYPACHCGLPHKSMLVGRP